MRPPTSAHWKNIHPRLQDLVGIFAKENLFLEDLMKLSYEDLKEIGVKKFKHRKLIAEEIEKIRTMPLKGVLSSSGGAALHQRGMLGQYEYDMDMGHYVQTNTERESEYYRAVYMYPDSDHRWWVGPCPGAKAWVNILPNASAKFSKISILWV